MIEAAVAELPETPEIEIGWLAERLIFRRTPDFSISNSSIDSFELAMFHNPSS